MRYWREVLYVVMLVIIGNALFYGIPAALSHAEAGVPTQPNVATEWCQGGAERDQEGLTRCDGTDYPDGSHWSLTRLYSGKWDRICQLHGKDEFGFPWAAPGGCAYLI